jgi:integrase
MLAACRVGDQVCKGRQSDRQENDWSRKSFHKRLNSFFAFAVRQRWVAANPVTNVPKVEPKRTKKDVYTADQLLDMLFLADLSADLRALVPFIVLSAYGFMRTSELVRLYLSEDALRWQDILWSKGKIHIRESVGKSTRRASGNERFIPTTDNIRSWLESTAPKEGFVIPLLHTEFSERWRDLHKKLNYELKPIHNGMRRSAISHLLAAEPDLGIVQAARWAGSSEATIKGHYLELLTQEKGAAWFVNRRFEKGKAR